MIKWITAKDYAAKIGKNERTVKRAAQAACYKNQPLIVRKEQRPNGGKPAYQILWNTETNQPAAQEQERVNSIDESGDKAATQITVQSTKARKPQTALTKATSFTATGEHYGQSTNHTTYTQSQLGQTVSSNQTLDTTIGDSGPVDSTAEYERGVDTHTTRTNAVVVALPCRADAVSQADENSDLSSETQARDEFEVSQGSGSEIDFEDLLHRYCIGKTASQAAALRYRYRKQYAQSGVVPAVLLGVNADGRKGRSGLKSTLPTEIKQRFEALIIERAAFLPEVGRTRYTKRHRRITVLHQTLEREFNQKIAINKLRTFLSKRPDLVALIQREDGEVQKERLPMAFEVVPVGKMIAMDGVQSDYFKLVGAGMKPLKPVFIELFDVGSRRLMAMHGYESESNENAADVFNRFIRGNVFVKQQMHIRPDNAKGFLNLKPVLRELNRYCKATKDGFAFIDDYARALKPKDKTHLESSHRALHDFEAHVISFFERENRIAGYEAAHRKVGNRLIPITVTLIDATLEQLNDSGVIQDYVNYHNQKKHRFTHDSRQVEWSPDHVWDQHIKDFAANHDGEILTFDDGASRLVKIHGCTKHDATISKDGTITFQKQRYAVEPELIKQGIWSRHSSTAIKVGRIDEMNLAIFHKEQARFLAEASLVQVQEKPQHIIDKTKAKVESIDTDTRRIEIADYLKQYGFVISTAENGNYQLIVQAIALGLDLALTKEILKERNEVYAKRPPHYRLSLFKTDVDKRLKKPERIVPYA